MAFLFNMIVRGLQTLNPQPGAYNMAAATEESFLLPKIHLTPLWAFYYDTHQRGHGGMGPDFSMVRPLRESTLNLKLP